MATGIRRRLERLERAGGSRRDARPWVSLVHNPRQEAGAKFSARLAATMAEGVNVLVSRIVAPGDAVSSAPYRSER